MDELGSLERKAPPLGGWLHFDVRLGCAGDMLTAALLDVGAPLVALREALAQAGLFGIGPLVREDRRGRLAGVHLSYVDEQGRALAPDEAPDPAQMPRRGEPLGAPTKRRTAAAPHRDHRRAAEAEEGTQAGSPGTGEDEAVTPIRPDLTLPPEAPEGASSSSAGQVSGPASGSVAAGRVAAWLDDEPADLEELAAFLARSKLAPIPAALARKALRRLQGAWEGPTTLPGRAGLDLLCDVVAVAALAASLDPVRMTCSTVGVSTALVHAGGRAHPGPGAVVLGCLDGLATVEHDLDHSCTTPTGAALIGALCAASGPRPVGRVRHLGTGLGSYASRQVANACRVMWCEPEVLEAEEGRSPSPRRAWRAQGLIHPDELDQVRAHLEGNAVGSASPASAGAFVEVISTGPGQAPDRGPALTVSILVDAPARGLHERAHEGADDQAIVHRALGALYAAGAKQVLVEPVEVFEPGLREVTVAIGSGNKTEKVTVRETLHDNKVVRADPDPSQVRRAAARLGLAEPIARAEVLAAWGRQGPEARAPTRATDEPGGTR